MIRKGSLAAGLAFLLAIACLWSTLPLTAQAAPITETETVPTGQTEFEISLNVNEAEPYAGIEFALTISDESALVFAAFAPGVSGATASPFVTKNGKHYFGFGAGSNAFPAGTALAGVLHFTGYTGSQALTVTIEQMTVFRLDTSGENAIKTEKESPAYVFTVQRDTSGGDSNDTPSQPGVPDGSGPAPGDPGGPGQSPGGAIIADNDTPLSGGFPFDDVHVGDWFYGDVAYVYENGLMNGTGATKFSPNTSLTRGMIVTILGRQFNVDASKYQSCAFSDVNDDVYYAPYIEWSRQNGIVLGVGNNRYEPDRAVSRQELAAILHRYASFAGFTLPVTHPYVQFLDENDIAAYAKDPIRALFSAGVIGGKPGNLFDPKGTATRAETAAMLHRFLSA
ncbi:MAG: S-layer homology domain-containing protein [Oscillospiraceae bacterium]|jgi:hypothetical protein|nr:S-layer homology domain-containing protein [Oscillospiraceae bacterium]